MTSQDGKFNLERNFNLTLLTITIHETLDNWLLLNSPVLSLPAFSIDMAIKSYWGSKQLKTESSCSSNIQPVLLYFGCKRKLVAMPLTFFFFNVILLTPTKAVLGYSKYRFQENLS